MKNLLQHIWLTRRLMITFIVLFFCIGVYTCSGQSKNYESNLYTSVKLTLDGSVLLNEGNWNLKFNYDTHFNGSDNWRTFIEFEILTGHNFGENGIGFYRLAIGTLYRIPYKIGKSRLSIEPGIDIGIIYRPNQPIRAVHYSDGSPSEYDLRGYYGFNIALHLKNSYSLSDRVDICFDLRLIQRSDINYAEAISKNHKNLPFFRYDGAVGLKYKI